MNRSLTTVLSLLLLECTYYCSCLLGEFDENCTRSKCKCCANNDCGPGSSFSNQCRSGCIDGHRGARCYYLCTIDDCKSCPTSADQCKSCYGGFYLSQTDCKKCPQNCKTCSSSTHCTSCKEGFKNSASSRTCDHSVCPANCECNQGDCVSCKNGFYDTKVSCNITCPINCVSCVSSEECGECKNGYYNGYGLYGGNNILLNNCTHKCRKTCVNCSSGDECLQCPNGKHGLQCQEECSAGCKDNICLIATGQCDCSSNFSGEKCTECIVGKTGEICEKKCSVNCKGGVCDKISGHCVDGCTTDNITGDECNKCVSGVYGELCDKPCPENCKGPCDFSTGICHACSQNRFSLFCNMTCPDNCNFSHSIYTSQCLSIDGRCVFGCEKGFFGLTCNELCSSICIGGYCTQEGGFCKNGCTGSNDDPVCALSPGKTQGTIATTASLATLLALTTAALCILIMKKIIKKIRDTHKQEKQSTLQIHYDNSLAGNQNSQNEGETAVAVDETVTYEIIDRTMPADEHVYSAADQNTTESTVNVGTNEYMNLKYEVPRNVTISS